MQIAICEDNGDAQELLVGAINGWAETRKTSVDCFCYPNAESFIFAKPEISFDLAFLDVQMETISGIELAEIIRKTDDKMLIVLLSIVIVFVGLNDFDENQNRLMIWLATGLLSILVVVFLLYEMFVREASDNIDLSAKLQRLELESHFINEIDVLYSDIRTWRHEYKNNMIALRALAEHGNIERITDYIDKLDKRPSRDGETLQTGNLILDAVVSSKLWFARNRGIDVSIQVVYPASNPIDDNGLCAIAGNLLDNAIEACLRINNENTSKFIVFDLLN